jgi:hypothetical protein
MTFTIQIFAWGFALLAVEFGLLPFDPTELGNRKTSDRRDLHRRRCRDSYAASGRKDAEMNVLDILEDEVDFEIAKLKVPTGSHRSASASSVSSSRSRPFFRRSWMRISGSTPPAL